MLPLRNDGTKRWRIVALILIPIVVLSAFSVWYAYGRPWSLDDVLNAERLPAGETWDLRGTVRAVRTFNTSYGSQETLDLEDALPCQPDIPVEGRTWRAGDLFERSIHWEPYSFDGHPAVWSPDLLCPFPILFASLGVVVDAVSMVMGFALVFVETDAEGWTTYEVLTPNGDRFSPQGLPVELRRFGPFDPEASVIDSAAEWIVTGATEYVRISGFGSSDPPMDRMTSLEGTSTNGTMRFEDVDAEGNVSDGDRLSVRLERAGENQWQSYLLVVRPPGAPGYAGAVKYLLNGESGPFEIFPWAEMPFVQLVHRTETQGPPPASILAIGRTLGPVSPVADYEVRITPKDGTPLTGSLASLPLRLPGGVGIDVRDANGVLDLGDEIMITGLANKTRYALELVLGGRSPNRIDWYAGYGYVARYLPSFSLEPLGGSPYVFEAHVEHWHDEFEFDRTAEVSLWEDGALALDRARLTNGSLGTFSGGNLTFADLDGDRTLSTGDEFRLVGTAGARYRLRVDILFGDRAWELEVTI